MRPLLRMNPPHIFEQKTEHRRKVKLHPWNKYVQIRASVDDHSFILSIHWCSIWILFKMYFTCRFIKDSLWPGQFLIKKSWRFGLLHMNLVCFIAEQQEIKTPSGSSRRDGSSGDRAVNRFVVMQLVYKRCFEHFGIDLWMQREKQLLKKTSVWPRRKNDLS